MIRWAWTQLAHHFGWALPAPPNSWAASCGMYSSDEAKMTGMTPAWFTLSGM